MRDLPLLGEPREERESWSCGYADAPCAHDAAWHGIVLADPDPAQDIAGMASCDEHLCAMKLTADFIHPHEHPCGIDGSRFRWPENECYTDWDELAESTAEKEPDLELLYGHGVALDLPFQRAPRCAAV